MPGRQEAGLQLDTLQHLELAAPLELDMCLGGLHAPR